VARLARSATEVAELEAGVAGCRACSRLVQWRETASANDRVVGPRAVPRHVASAQSSPPGASDHRAKDDERILDTEGKAILDCQQ
jgi:hypothetical protein